MANTLDALFARLTALLEGTYPVTHGAGDRWLPAATFAPGTFFLPEENATFPADNYPVDRLFDLRWDAAYYGGTTPDGENQYAAPHQRVVPVTLRVSYNGQLPDELAQQPTSRLVMGFAEAASRKAINDAIAIEAVWCWPTNWAGLAPPVNTIERAGLPHGGERRQASGRADHDVVRPADPDEHHQSRVGLMLLLVPVGRLTLESLAPFWQRYASTDGPTTVAPGQDPTPVNVTFLHPTRNPFSDRPVILDVIALMTGAPIGGNFDGEVFVQCVLSSRGFVYCTRCPACGQGHIAGEPACRACGAALPGLPPEALGDGRPEAAEMPPFLALDLPATLASIRRTEARIEAKGKVLAVSGVAHVAPNPDARRDGGTNSLVIARLDARYPGLKARGRSPGRGPRAREAGAGCGLDRPGGDPAAGGAGLAAGDPGTDHVRPGRHHEHGGDHEAQARPPARRGHGTTARIRSTSPSSRSETT